MPVNLTVGLSVDEYLDRSFDPACELLGGETRPKPFGTGKHSKMRRRLLRLLEEISTKAWPSSRAAADAAGLVKMRRALVRPPPGSPFCP
jgi:hypothetical protein